MIFLIPTRCVIGKYFHRLNFIFTGKKMHRKRLSGAQYKKAAREKEEREKKAINQTIKLDNFFFVKNIDDANQTNVNSSSTVLDQSNNLITTDSVEIINKVKSYTESETPNLTTEKIIHETISTPELCNVRDLSFSFNKDTAFWTVNEEARDYFSMNGFDVNVYKNSDFINSKVKSRCMTKNMFERLLPNGEKIERFWQVYSESTGKAFCGPCFFFSSHNDDSYLSTQGFNDWKNAQSRFKQHECSTNRKHDTVLEV